MIWLLGLLATAFAGAACKVTPTTKDGVRYYVVRAEETGSRDTTELVCSGVPPLGTILSFEATLSAGTGTTLHPVIGRAASFSTSTQDHVATATATAAFIHEQGATYYAAPAGVLYIRNTPNSTATDHTISTEVLIVEGAP